MKKKSVGVPIPTPGRDVWLRLASIQLSFRATKVMETSGNTIKLDQFLKLVGVAPTGGQAKLLIQGGDVKVNGAIETRRGRKLVLGDKVMIGGQTFEVELNNF